MKLTIIYLLLALVNLAFAVKESSNKARLSKRVLKEGLEKNSEHIQKRGGTGGMYTEKNNYL